MILDVCPAFGAAALLIPGGRSLNAARDMFGFKYAKPDLQQELVTRAAAEGIAFTIDSNGFAVVQSKQDHHRLESIRNDIDKRAFQDVRWWSSESEQWLDERREAFVRRAIHFHEYETISDDVPEHLRQRGVSIWHLYGLALRFDPALGQPWDPVT